MRVGTIRPAGIALPQDLGVSRRRDHGREQHYRRCRRSSRSPSHPDHLSVYVFAVRRGVPLPLRCGRPACKSCFFTALDSVRRDKNVHLKDLPLKMSKQRTWRQEPYLTRLVWTGLDRIATSSVTDCTNWYVRKMRRTG
jgi:hypothetical protein